MIGPVVIVIKHNKAPLSNSEVLPT